ncbi:MAG TPA: FecR family protein [Blastocatellia bacterium]|nr:FecR family protein [Blastocatellia bacterium]
MNRKTHPPQIAAGLSGILLILAVCLFAHGLAQAQAESHVAAFSGRPVLTRNAATLALRRGERLLPGDEIVTGANARIVLSLSDGSRIVVYPGSHVRLRDFSGAGSLRDLMEILAGRVRARIQHYGGRPNPYRVNTPVASIAVRGTDSLVSVEAGGNTRVTVFEGAVEVSSLFNPQRRTRVEAGRTVTVRVSGDIGYLAPGPGSELNATARLSPDRVNPFDETFGSYLIYLDRLTTTNEAAVPARFAAFADANFDSLDNPAYATEFVRGEGRLYLLPSLSGARQHIATQDRSRIQQVHPFDHAVFTQLSYFAPVGDSRTVLGGAVSLGSTNLQSYSIEDRLLGALPNTYAERGQAQLNTANLSFLAARRFGALSAGVKLEQLIGRGRSETTFTSEDQDLFSATTFASRGRVDRTRLTLGLTRDFASNRKLGVFLRHGQTPSRQRDRMMQRDVYQGEVFLGRIDPLLDNQTSSRTTELGLRWRAPLTRQLLYGAESSLLHESVRRTVFVDNTLSGEPNETLRSTATITRAALGGGIGYLRRVESGFSQTFSLDAATGLRRAHSSAVSEPSLRANSGSTSTRFLTLHFSAQAGIYQRVFFGGSWLTAQDWSVSTSAAGGRRNSSSIRHVPGLSLGWLVKPELLLQYVRTTGSSRSTANNGAFTSDRAGTPSHSLMLRYTFSFNAAR